jgi:hypothetical protein
MDLSGGDVSNVDLMQSWYAICEYDSEQAQMGLLNLSY